MVKPNLIILLGNGFDLAHGHKTSYNNFANFLFLELITNIRKFQNNLLNQKKYGFKQDFANQLRGNSQDSSYNLSSLVSACTNSRNRNTNTYLIDYLSQNKDEIKYVIENNFIGKLFDQYNENMNWYEIENAYFKELKLLKKSNPQNRVKEVVKLNSDFKEVKKKLTEYLKTIKITNNNNVHSFFKNIPVGYINIYVINFNYTNTFTQYQKYFTDEVIVNNIHGSLSDDNIIFGYGNDKNDDYQQMKSLEIDDFLKHFKTFEYLRDSNYQNLINHIKGSFKYDVYVVGHSLGLTDKTLLSELFNNSNCNQIHLFKRLDYKSDNTKLYESFSTLSYAAARIIDKEEDARMKIINFKDLDFFPSSYIFR